MKGLVRIITLVGLMCASATVFAGKTLTVGPDGTYKTIGLALADAVTGDTISVAPKTYIENITLKSGVTLVGAETARTFLQAANNASPVITASGVTECRISRLTFIASTTGIQISNSSVVTIAANVFNLGAGGTAVSVIDSTDTSTISNNTFYANKLAVSRAGVSTTIKNNIFASNTTAISSADAAGISFNLFFPNTADGQMGTPIDPSGDPLFVNPIVNSTKSDFHLKATSVAIDKGTDTDLIDGTPADLGAYGGLYADPKPYPVQDVRWSGSNPAVISPAFELTLSWQPNESYLIDSYNVQFTLTGTTGNVVNFGPSATPGTSPQNVVNVSSIVLSGSAQSAADSLASPVLNPIEPKSHALMLTWSPVDTATSYEVHDGITEDRVTAIEEPPVNVGDVTTYSLSGLQNGKTYMVWVVAVKQPTLHVAVNAQDRTHHVGDYSTVETKALGNAIKSDVPIPGFGIPEDIVAFPALPNEGCFIATAAYGSYSAAQVKTLRDFRDHYLLTNTPGRAFVGWYYANSPPAAHYLNQHPALKPVVRGLLLPFVFITSWMNGSMLATQVAVIVLALGMLSLGIYWRRRTSWA